MVKRVASLLAVWVLILVGCFVFGEAPVQTSPDVAAQAIAPPIPSSAGAEANQSVDRQMQGLARHAQLGMLLYTGSLPSDPLPKVEAVAVTVRVGAR
jgi:hypothetical protein